MEYACSNIPVPVSYSPLKHHFHCQLAFVRQFNPEETGSIMDSLVLIGDNAIDVYSGNLSVIDVCLEILGFLGDRGIRDMDCLNGWLGIREFREVILSDGSRWVIRLSEKKDRYVHIHPGKRSVHTFRLRGTTLKTVLALCILPVNQSGNNVPDIEIVNNVRKESLGLSPVKNLSENGNILKWFNFYRNLLNS